MLIPEKPPIEARMLSVLERNQERLAGLRSPGGPRPSVRENCGELSRRYCTLRRLLVEELAREIAEKYPRERLSDQMDYENETFVFDTAHGCYSNSRVSRQVPKFERMKLSAAHKVMDMGVGLGELSFAAALFGARVTAMEINPYLLNCAGIIQKAFSDLPGIGSVDLRQGDFLAEDIGGYDVYMLHLPESHRAAALKRVNEQAGKGAILLASKTHVNPTDNWNFDDALAVFTKQE